jgi:hypothetical protein
MTLRYEDFIAEPRTAVQRVLTLLGEKAEPPLDDTRVHLSSGHAVSGNPMRFESGVVTMSEDDQWRDDLPTSTRRLVSALTWPALSAHHYLRVKGS